MSAVTLMMKTGALFYTKDYNTVEEVDRAIRRDESITVFWYTSWGKRYQETLRVDREDVSHFLTEREIP